MPVIVKGKNVEITDALRKYAEEKISRVKKHFNEIMKTEIEMIVEKNPSIVNNNVVEVTLFTKGPVIRAKGSSTNMYASIDQVTEKLERQIEKFKGKTYSSKMHPSSSSLQKMMESERKEEEKPKIVKTKRFLLKPMSPEEAVLQMDLLGHDFFVFTNSETEEVNIVYRRKNNTFGLIEPGL